MNGGVEEVNPRAAEVWPRETRGATMIVSAISHLESIGRGDPSIPPFPSLPRVDANLSRLSARCVRRRNNEARTLPIYADDSRDRF